MTRRPGFYRLIVSLLLIPLFSLRVVAASPAQETVTPPPPQPVALRAVYRSGQTFLTWQERQELVGETYRVYRHNAPITAANVHQAVLLYEVPEGSARFFANRYYSYAVAGWTPRYLERFVIEDHGPELEPGTGLLVWTLAPEDFGGQASGAGYYAVTTVADGVENVQSFGPDNTVGPVAEAVDDPLPVEIDTSLGAGWHVFIQYMDLRHWNPTFHAPNALNSYYGLDWNDPEVANAIQYAYDYAVFVPDPARCGGDLPTRLPVTLNLHAWGGNSYGPPGGSSAKPWCAVQVMPIDVSETWWFGFARDHDYRKGGSPGAGDTIVNYTEQRVLRMLYDLSRQPGMPPLDMQRVYVYGHSMGASGALALATRYPGVFAAAYASKPMTDYRTSGGWKGTLTPRWGSDTLNIPITLSAPAGWGEGLQAHNGTGVWDWQDHQRNMTARQEDAMVPIGASMGINDTSVPWESQGAPMLAALDASRQPWGARVLDNGHNWDEFLGLPPNLAKDASGVPFAGLQVVRDETVPGLSRASGNPAIPPTQICGYNQTISWSSSWDAWAGPPLDTPTLWQMTLRSLDGEQTVDVTPRRLQAFPIVPGASYYWTNHRLSDGRLVGSGTITPDAQGLLTIPDALVLPAGNRLTIHAEAAHALYLPFLER